MTDFFTMFIDCMWELFNVVDSKATFELFGFEIGFFSLCIGFIILFMVVSVIWRGVRG